MFINKNSLIINSVNMGNYTTQVQYGFNKLWSSDSGRNLAGTQTGTLVGIFPKIIVTFRRLNKSEMEVISPILDSASQTVSYYDPTKKAQTTMTTYTGDYEYTDKSIINSKRKNGSFTCSFISRSKRV